MIYIYKMHLISQKLEVSKVGIITGEENRVWAL